MTTPPASAAKERRPRIELDVRFWLVAAALPAVLVFYLNATYTLNHFYTAPGPFLHDAGWFSWIVWRQGLIPSNPAVADGNASFWSVHASPLVSLGSLGSYVFPWDRVDYYAVFQGFIYAPLALAPALLVGPQTERRWPRVLLVAFTALAFALSGQVLACAGFPHFEIFVPAGIAIMLAGLAAGRPRVAWLGLFMALITREEGGFHAALFLVAVLACDLSKRPFPVARRTVLAMTVIAGLGSVALLGSQRFFPSSNLFRNVYLGTPIYGHISASVLAERAKALVERAPFICAPFAATLVVAAVKRDARYLLGWVAELPWFLLNFLAHEKLKSEFAIYVGFPFVASLFWLAAYGRTRTEASRTTRALAPFAVVCVLSTLAWWWGAPAFAPAFAQELVWPRADNREALRAFARPLRADPNAYGNIYVDTGVSCWALDRMRPETHLWDWDPDLRAEGHDGIAFFAGSNVGVHGVEMLLKTPFTSCGRIAGPDVYFCGRQGRPLPPTLEPRSLLADMLVTTPNARRVGKESFEIGAAPGPTCELFGPFATLPPGSYIATWEVRPGECAPGAQLPRVDVFASGKVFAERDVANDARTIELAFDVPAAPAAGPVELRAFAGACGYKIEAVRLDRGWGSP